MRDLTLLRELGSKEPDDTPDLASGPSARSTMLEELGSLAALAPRGRVAFVAALIQLADAPAPELRAAVIKALAGLRGRAVVTKIVSALSDEHASVRAAAVEALRVTARDAPARWAHAIFHQNPEVRRLALAGTAPTHAAHLGTYLRVDPQLRPKAEKAPWPRRSLALLFDLRRRGVVSAPEAARRLAQTDLESARSFLVGSHRRSEEQLSQILASARGAGHSAEEEDPGADVLDEWWQIVTSLEASDDHPSDPSADAMRVFLSVVLDAAQPQLRLRAAATVLLATKSEHTPASAEFCTACWPSFLTMTSIPRALRRHAAIKLYDHRSSTTRPSGRSIEELLALDIMVEQDGAPALGPAIAVVSIGRRMRLQRLVERFTLAGLVEGLERDLVAWRMLCELPREPKLDAETLLAKIRESTEHGSLPPRHLAIALCSWASGAARRYSDLASQLPPDASGPIVLAIAELENRKTICPRQAPTLRVVRQLLNTMDSNQSRELLAGLLALGGAVSTSPPSPGPSTRLIVGEMARQLGSKIFAKLVGSLDSAQRHRLLQWIRNEIALPALLERVLAGELQADAEPSVRAWAHEVLNATSTPGATRRAKRVEARELTPSERNALATSSEADLVAALAPALLAPTHGLCASLSKRPAPSTPDIDVCTALLGCHDPLEQVGTIFGRFGASESEFVDRLTVGAVAAWQGHPNLGPLGNAWLCSWESHAFGLMQWATTHAGGLEGALREAMATPCAPVRRQLWIGLSHVFTLWRYRDSERLARLVSLSILELCAAQLDTELGEPAARMLVAVHLAGVHPEAVEAQRDTAQALAPDTDDATRTQLERWLSVDGLPSRPRPARMSTMPMSALETEEVRKLTDLDRLVAICEDARAGLVHEATLRLVELGETGLRRLVDLLDRRLAPACTATIVESIALWPEGRALAAVRSFTERLELAPHVRFRVAIALAERGEANRLDVAIECVREDTPPGWFSRADWDRLWTEVDRSEAHDGPHLARHVADSPHPHAYQPAVAQLLLSQGEAERAALLRFLDKGTTRPKRLRRAAACCLTAAGDWSVLPIICELVTDSDAELAKHVLAGAPTQLGTMVVMAALAGGSQLCSEQRALEIVEAMRLSEEARGALLELMMREGLDPVVRQRIGQIMGPGPRRDDKLSSIAEVFAWGVRRGRELTGQLFAVHTTSRREDFGYTQLDKPRIFVSPLALLRDDRHGKQIVEALVLHELGHHVHHGGEAAAKIWSRAQREGLFSLLNVVADEHLERNLRALDPSYGDRLKRLAAYAFQHSEREIPLERVLAMLVGGSFEALSAEAPGVAYHDDSLVIARGKLLRELDRAGQPFARFMRALRMGLGNRHQDPRVAAGLELFKHGFRHLDMAGLWELTLQLAQIFGGSTSLAQSIGGHEVLDWDERETSIESDGIDDDDVQREVERILRPNQKGRPHSDGGRPTLSINVADERAFDSIHIIERVVDDPALHRALASEVRRDATRLGSYLSRLGLALAPQGARLRGRAFDRTRTRAVVLRRDPRMLVARETQAKNDLFIGVAIDCSGSMSIGKSMDKAKRFAMLLADAAGPLSGVDVRFIGFSDDTLYDAGDDLRCAVASLPTGGGNNDAAALEYLSRLAGTSPRRAKLLVMISDGLPTECSVDALRSLVERLSRRHGLLCAQIAVRPLEEVCFRHYVEVKDVDVSASVRRFGEIISTLARRALGA